MPDSSRTLIGCWKSLFSACFRQLVKTHAIWDSVIRGIYRSKIREWRLSLRCKWHHAIHFKLSLKLCWFATFVSVFNCWPHVWTHYLNYKCTSNSTPFLFRVISFKNREILVKYILLLLKIFTNTIQWSEFILQSWISVFKRCLRDNGLCFQTKTKNLRKNFS